MMNSRLWLSCFAVICTMGCQKFDPPPVVSTSLKGDENGTTTPNDIRMPVAGMKTRAATDAGDPVKKDAEPPTKLTGKPEDATSLMQLAMSTNGNNANTESEKYDLFKKSADYLRRALEVDPDVTQREMFKSIAPRVFYRDACAQSREKQEAASLKSLKRAVEFGFNAFEDLKSNPDLDPIRQNPQFATIEETVRQTYTKAKKEWLDSLFDPKHVFEFDFNLKDTNGQPVSKQEFSGKLLMVIFWGTWCRTCCSEVPGLVAVHEKYKSQGFEILGMNDEKETGDKAIELIKLAQKEFGITYRCALTDQETLDRVPEFNVVPTSVFFDRQGHVIARWDNLLSKSDLEAIVERLLKNDSAHSTAPGPAK